MCPEYDFEEEKERLLDGSLVNCDPSLIRLEKTIETLRGGVRRTWYWIDGMTILRRRFIDILLSWGVPATDLGVMDERIPSLFLGKRGVDLLVKRQERPTFVLEFKSGGGHLVSPRARQGRTILTHHWVEPILANAFDFRQSFKRPDFAAAFLVLLRKLRPTSSIPRVGARANRKKAILRLQNFASSLLNNTNTVAFLVLGTDGSELFEIDPDRFNLQRFLESIYEYLKRMYMSPPRKMFFGEW